MVRKILSLIMLSFFLAIGGLWASRAQDPTPQKPQTPAQTPATMPQTPATMPQTERQTMPARTTQVDLSGTYAGTFNCAAAGLTGDTTLTINGNEFTTADGRSGRIIASKTNGYTAVAIQVKGTDANATPQVISLRGKKSGNKLTLSPVAGAKEKCTFVTSKNVARGRKTPAATGTEVANPAAVPAESPMPNQEPSPSPSPSPTPSASPTPSGSPRPMPSPTPVPSPSPGEPTPSPSPNPSPSPAPRS